MYDDKHLTHDAAVVEFHSDVDGVTRDDDGSLDIDWDDVETVRIDDPPYADQFGTKQFYKLPATLARPIRQPYQYGEDTVWLKKPREELKKAAWSLNNAPWTHDHPDTGMVKDVDDVHGFWRDPRYIDGTDDLDADLHFPVGDDESTETIERSGDVSVGFYNEVMRTDEYDGIVGGEDADADDLDGYQANMLFDHGASVDVGRCPGSKGCGFDDRPHGHVDPFKRDADITHETEDRDMHETTDQPSGIHVADGTWFAVGPDDHSKDSTDYPDEAMYPVNNCSDVEDAWNLRNNSDALTIDVSTLEARIKRVADSKDCSGMPWVGDSAPTTDDIAASAERYSIGGRCADCGDDNTTQDNQHMEFDIDTSDLSTDAILAKIGEEHDGVQERLDEYTEAEDRASVADDAADELDLDDTDDLVDTVAMLQDRKEELEDEKEDLREKVDELQRPDMEDDAAFIAEHTDRFGEDVEDVLDELDEDPEAVADKRDLVEDLVDGYQEMDANPDPDDGGSKAETTDAGYARTPWE